jgi:hypothetical protein
VLAEADRDVMYDPVQNEGLFLFVVSQPIGDSTPEDWVAARMAEPVPEQGCATPEPITVDGATGLIGAGDCDLAVVTTAGRGYEIFFYNDHAFDALYDRAWFEEVLATIQLQPEDAVDVAPPPPLNQAFTSQVHGITLSYPEGWIARGATEPWRDRPGVPQFTDPGYDVLRDPVLDDRVFLDITSQPIGDATPADWLAAIPAGSGCTTAEPITVDGAPGVIGANDCNVVWVTTAGRGYTIELFRSNDDPAAVAPYDRAWFEEVLATIQLQPGDAVDAAPSATP